MRIAITSDLCLLTANGVAVSAKALAEGLARAGHTVMTISPSDTGKKYRKTVHFDRSGREIPPEKVKNHPRRGGQITYVYLKSVRLHLYPDQIHEIPAQKEVLGKKVPRLLYKNGLLWSPWPGRQVKKALDRFRPDVIHNQTAETIAVAVHLYARRRGVPLVATNHSYPDNITGQLKLINTRPLLPAKKSLDKLLNWWMNSFIKHSEYATMPTQIAIDDNVPKNRKRFTVPVEALSNGVNLEAFKPGRVPAAIRKRYNLPAGRPTALYLGRLDGEKSVDVVIAAFAQVVEAVPQTRLVVVGDGVAKSELEAQARKLGLAEAVQFLGRVVPPDVYDLYRAADLFVTASKTETQGIVLIEAAATGLPLVAVDQGAVRELCQDGVNGILCPADDVDTMATGMVRLLQDPKLRKKYGQASLKVAAQHDFRRTLRRFVEIYEEAIRLKKAKQRQK